MKNIQFQLSEHFCTEDELTRQENFSDILSAFLSVERDPPFLAACSKPQSTVSALSHR